MNYRQQAAIHIMAGLVSNPCIIAYSPACGWDLVNTTPEKLADFAVALADAMDVATDQSSVDQDAARMQGTA